jgi:hypothetical protein
MGRKRERRERRGAALAAIRSHTCAGGRTGAITALRGASTLSQRATARRSANEAWPRRSKARRARPDMVPST